MKAIPDPIDGWRPAGINSPHPAEDDSRLSQHLETLHVQQVKPKVPHSVVYRPRAPHEGPGLEVAAFRTQGLIDWVRSSAGDSESAPPDVLPELEKARDLQRHAVVELDAKGIPAFRRSFKVA